MEYRTGTGYDIHRLVKGRPLYLGGVRIPYAKGLLGHSDADVLLHALCDALLGAVGAEDIGTHFPDTDPAYKGVSSLVLVRRVAGIVSRKGYEVGNVDGVVILEEPKLREYRPAIRDAISRALSIDKDRVSIKAKTNEGLGEVGKKQAIAAFVSVLVKSAGKRNVRSMKGKVK